MVITATFTEPEDFVSFGKDLVEAIAVDVDEFIGGFFDDDFLFAGVGIDFEETVFSESSFDKGTGKNGFCGVPEESVDVVGIFN